MYFLCLPIRKYQRKGTPRSHPSGPLSNLEKSARNKLVQLSLRSDRNCSIPDFSCVPSPSSRGPCWVCSLASPGADLKLTDISVVKPQWIKNTTRQELGRSILIADKKGVSQLVFFRWPCFLRADVLENYGALF